MKPWNECKKPHRLAMEFFGAVGKNAFPGGRPTRDFFKKLDEPVLNLFHEYLIATGGQPGLTMTGLFYKAQAWNQKQRTAIIKETHIENYLDLLKDW